MQIVLECNGVSTLNHPAWKNGPQLADDIFKSIFMNEEFCISNQI